MIRYLVLLSFLLYFSLFSLFAQEYRIEVQMEHLSEVDVYLGYHYGNEQFVIDTAHLDKSGKGFFSRKKELPEGVYMIVLPSMTYFDFLIADVQKFSIKNDTLDLTGKLDIKGSPQNELFTKYQKFTSQKHREIYMLSTSIRQYPDSEKVYTTKIEQLQNDIVFERNRIISTYPKTFFSTLLKAMIEPEIPKELALNNDLVTIEKRIDFLSHHFFDNYDFSDERLLFSPVLYNKLSKYFTEMMTSSIDSINISVDHLLLKTMQNPVVYKYTLNQLMTFFDVSGELTNDEAFVYIAENYYYTGLASWVSDDFIGKLKIHVEGLRPTLAGALAPTLVLSDPDDKKISLDDIKSCYTAVFFWNPECEHCVEYLSGLIKVRDKYPSEYFQIYAVLAEQNVEKWKRFIKENPLNVIHVYDPKSKNSFIETYKLYMTPRVYILDKTKHIVFKDISIDQLNYFLTKQKSIVCK